MPAAPIIGIIGGGIAGMIKGYAMASGTGIQPAVLDAIVTYGPVPVAAAIGGIEGSIANGLAGAFGWGDSKMPFVYAGATAVTTLIGEGVGIGIGYLLGK